MNKSSFLAFYWILMGLNGYRLIDISGNTLLSSNHAARIPYSVGFINRLSFRSKRHSSESNVIVPRLLFTRLSSSIWYNLNSLRYRRFGKSSYIFKKMYEYILMTQAKK